MWISTSGRRGNLLLNFYPWLITFFCHISLIWLWNVGASGNLDHRDTESCLPSDNDASLLAVNHYISVWVGHTTGQQSSRLLGTQQHSGRANQALVPGKSGLSPVAIFAMDVENLSTEKQASNIVGNIAWCWWSRTPTWYAVHSMSHYSLINFLFCFDFSCIRITWCKTPLF